tara:strand:+ start:2667 stop:4352 length:1686 start_codon:yes stop_codon:yes gene_type:complete
MDEGRIAQMLRDARSHADSGDMLIASQLYTSATRLEPESAAAWYGLGVVQTARGMPEEAILAFEESDRVNPGHGPTMANLAVLLENKDPQRASNFAKEAIKVLGEMQQLSEIAQGFDEPVSEDPPLSEEYEEELLVLESREVTEPELILDSRPVETIQDVIESAKIMIRENRASDALNKIRARLDDDGSQSFELWAMCASCLSIVGHTNEALESIEYAITLGDDRAKTHFNHSQILRGLGRENDAMKSLSNALLSDPEHVKSLISLGDMRADIGNYEEAVSIWEKALELETVEGLESRIVEARLRLATVEEDSQDISPVVDTVSIRIAKAKEMTERGDHVDSVKVWKELLEDNREDPLIWEGMADSLSAAGHIDRALQCRQKAKSLEASEEVVAVDEIEETDLIAAGKEAQEILESQNEASDLDLNVSIEWYNKGVNLLAEERSSEALSAFEKAIGGAPREELELRVKAQAGRGHALYQMGKYGDSIRSYHTAISMNPEAVGGKILYNMGSSYASLELFEDAVKCFIQALDRRLDQHDRDLCKKQLSRCKILAKEQARRSR